MTIRRYPAVAALLLCALFATAAWPAIAAPEPVDPSEAESEALCDRNKGAEPPVSDRPTASQQAALQECDGEALLYGIGRPADPAQAKLCAFVQQAKGDAQLFSGAGLLITIYANGIGVPRNPPVAIHLACDGLPSAPAEFRYRVAHLAGLRTRFAPGAMFSPCDDITSGASSAACAMHDARLRRVGVQDALDRFAAALPAAARPAFAALRAAQQDWAEARANGEVDQSGSAAGAFVVDEQKMQDDDFAAMLKRLRNNKPPALGAGRLRTATARIDAVLPKLMAQTPVSSLPGGVKADGIRAAQRAWTSYRDAWGRFAAIAYPGWGADGAEAWVSLKRADMLEHLLSERD